MIEKSYKDLDIPIMLKMLQKDMKISQKELANILEISPAYLRKILSERVGTKFFNPGLALLIVFLKETNRTIPYIGEYHAEFSES